MTHFTPESGLPLINLDAGESFDENSLITFANGEIVTGAHLNLILRHYFNENPRGKALAANMRGEGPEPEFLFTVEGDNADNGSLYLESTGLDVTTVEPHSSTIFEILASPDQSADY